MPVLARKNLNNDLLAWRNQGPNPGNSQSMSRMSTEKSSNTRQQSKPWEPAARTLGRCRLFQLLERSAFTRPTYLMRARAHPTCDRCNIPAVAVVSNVATINLLGRVKKGWSSITGFRVGFNARSGG